MELTCIIIDDEPHTISELEVALLKQSGIKLLKSFSGSAAALIFLKQRKKVDIIFCDINLPGLNGIQAAKLLLPYCDFLIYVTAHSEHALEAFGVHAHGYLLKPVNEVELLSKLADLIRMRNQLGKKHEEEYLYIKGEHKRDIIKLLPSEVVYVQAMSNYISIHKKGTDIHVLYMSLRDMNNTLLPFGCFVRISRSIIVNLNYLVACDSHIVTLENGLKFNIGETYHDFFHLFMRKHVAKEE